MKNEYDEEITDEVGTSGYGDKVGKCDKCEKEVIIHTDWLTNVYEESIAFYQCNKCAHKEWWYF